MRMLKIFALAAVVLAFAAAAPSHAACATAKVIATSTADGQSFIWTDGWPALYFTSQGVTLPPLAYAADGPPYTADVFGVYWQLGAGDTTLGVGVDAGGNTVPPGTWLYWYNYQDVIFFAGNIFENWTLPSVDLCMANSTCECVLLTDQKDGVGYFAIASGMTTSGGDLSLTQAGTDPVGNSSPIKLMAMPTPNVTRIDMDMATHDLTFNVNVPPPVEGVYQKDGCDCGPFTYAIYEMQVPRGNPAPGDRDAAAWGVPVATAAIGTPSSYVSACGSAEVDVYLATALIMDSDFPGGPYPVTLSANSGPYPCGPTIAEPVDLQPKVRERHLRGNPRSDRNR